MFSFEKVNVKLKKAVLKLPAFLVPLFAFVPLRIQLRILRTKINRTLLSVVFRTAFTTINYYLTRIISELSVSFHLLYCSQLSAPHKCLYLSQKHPASVYSDLSLHSF